jgi:DNA-binding response OmpR family regulator
MEAATSPRPTVLVVEDERNIRELVCLHLGLENYECVQAGDGEEALKLARSRHFDLVILESCFRSRRRDRLPRHTTRLREIPTCRS